MLTKEILQYINPLSADHFRRLAESRIAAALQHQPLAIHCMESDFPEDPAVETLLVAAGIQIMQHNF